jgi:hypothetical protein
MELIRPHSRMRRREGKNRLWRFRQKRSRQWRSAADRYLRERRAAALIILSDPHRYGGGVLTEWAECILASQQPTVHGPLFDGRLTA